ncbi:MAG: CcmD family protein [Bacteroidota bacterium]|jgi:hypothetical protein
MKQIAQFILMIVLAGPLAAQQSVDDKLYESLHGHASFHAVFTVLFIILGGILFYLFRLDRKVTRLEKDLKK